MLIELGTFLTCAYALNEFKNRDIRKLKKDWRGIMENAKSEGIRNKNNQSFELLQAERKDYGYKCIISIPHGLNHSSLFKAKEAIEDSLGCIIELKKDKFKKYIEMDIIEDLIENTKFEPYETKPNELFMGYKYNGEEYLLDLTKDPHIILSGKTGTGKSFLLASILTNLIYYHKKTTELYLLQLMKGDINIFKDCPNVKFSSTTADEIMIALKKLNDIINTRSLEFAEQGVKNIAQWNKHFKNRQMKRIIVVVEEISFFMKNEIAFEYFNAIVKAGRASGVHLICLTQRTTSANLGGNGELKSQMTVITAKQRSELDSRNAIDIEDAAYLDNQEFISSCNDGYVYFKSCWVDEDFKVLNKYVPEIKVPKKNIKIKNKVNDPNITIITIDQKEDEHEQWCKERGIKITEIDLNKQRKERQELACRIEHKKISEATPNISTNKKKGKISLKEVALDAETKR